MRRILCVSSSQGSMGKNAGCEKAPGEILKYVRNDFDAGCVDVIDGDMESTNKNVYKKATNFEGVIIGGDHSITYPCFLAMEKRHKRCGLIMLDAHVDCASYIKPPSHEDFLRVLLEDRVVKDENVAVIGARKIYKAEMEFLKKREITIIKNANNFSNLLDRFKLLDAVYLTIDIDVFDPCIAMGTRYLVKNGLDKTGGFELLSKIRELKNLDVVDIVEVNPRLDKNKKTIKLAAEIADFFHG